eukprot:CAMPEP_0177645896 /NCGR_PEP_ID=MMETSP0447-20121125/9489_1 /TAXON_ID=0 /ORGANISM="Stygamoeba regulata, Strain BSH-02190019" /LENGTH=194 /DNA_ID=CAMNT_0019148401 /DNA_START=167 /DNA_END=751 /DNA_ORIENTATION=-
MEVLRIALLALALLACSANGIIFKLDPHREECFHEQLVLFQVVAGGFLDIDVQVTNPEGSLIYNGEKEKEGRPVFHADSTGRYRFCFSNRMSTVSQKEVDFMIHIGDEIKPIAKAEHLTPLEQSILELSDNLYAVKMENHYFRLRERTHRNTVESTNERVLWYSILEFCVLVGVNGWNIYFLRRLFENRKVGGV